tara:strand:+ start:1589 stop:2098 length:510 start_codon:yes stop_codon:yes gene_type:complete
MGNHNLHTPHDIISALPDEDLTAWITRGGKLPSYYWTLLDNLLHSKDVPTCVYSTPVKILEPLVLQAISDAACDCNPEASADFHDALYFLGLKPRLNYDDDAVVSDLPGWPTFTVKRFLSSDWFQIWIDGKEVITEAGDTFCIHEVLDWLNNWNAGQQQTPEERDCCVR